MTPIRGWGDLILDMKENTPFKNAWSTASCLTPLTMVLISLRTSAVILEYSGIRHHHAPSTKDTRHLTKTSGKMMKRSSTAWCSSIKNSSSITASMAKDSAASKLWSMCLKSKKTSSKNGRGSNEMARSAATTTACSETIKTMVLSMLKIETIA